MRKDDIHTILEHIDSDLKSIQACYEDSLHKKEIPATLRVDIKNTMENLRSCLDYMAQDIDEVIVLPYRQSKGMKPTKTVYFPYGKTQGDFDTSVQNNLPDLGTLSRSVYDLIESIQPHKAGNSWLYDFCSILNSNKHDSLSPQERIEQKRYQIGLEGRGPSISAPAGAIKAPPGAISIGGRPLIFDPKSGIPIQTPGLEVSVTVWVDFKFKDTGISVLPLLRTAWGEINRVFGKLYEELT